MHGIAVSHCGIQDADDLTQDVFLEVQRRLEENRDSAALAGWICSIARNKSIDLVRRRTRRPKTVVLPEVPARDLRNEAETAQHMLGRLRELPEPYRETLTLRLVEGLSGDEIAETTGAKCGAVRVRLHRGMAMLRDRLAKDGLP